MNTQDFKITKNGLLNYDTGTFLPFEKYQTKKGEWSKKLLKALGLMDNTDLNRFNKVYGRVYGIDQEIVAEEFVNIIPKFRTQKVNVYVDGKFYKARTFKRASYVKVGVNEFRKPELNDLVENASGDYVVLNAETDKLIEQLKKLNLGTQLEVKVDLRVFNQKKIFQLLKSNIIDQKVIASTDGGQTWITLSERTMKKILNHTEDYIATGSGSDAQYGLTGDITGEMIIKVVDYAETYANSDQWMGVVGGEFFRFHHKIPNLDLEHLGIFSVNAINSKYHTYLNDNCLYWALKACGVEQDKLELMKTFVVNRNVPISKLNIVCEKLGIQIKLIRLKGKKSNQYDKTETTTFGSTGELCNIGLLDTHYFVLKDSGIQRYALNNCFDIEPDKEKDWTKICEKRANGNYKYRNDRTIDTFLLVKTLIQNREKYLKPIEWTDEMINTQYHDKVETFGDLNYNNDNIKPNPPSQKEIEYLTDESFKKCWKTLREIKKENNNEFTYENVLECFPDVSSTEHDMIYYNYGKLIKHEKKTYYKIYFDFETYADKKDNLKHKPYLCCYETEDGQKGYYTGAKCARKFLDNLPQDKGENIMLIAHNCGYDYKFLFDLLSSMKPIMKGTGLMSCDAKYFKNKVSYTDAGGIKDNGAKNIKKDSKLEFQWNIKMKDSYKLIPEPLRKFGKMFKLKQGKEVIPYKLYNNVFSSYGISKIWYKEKYVYDAVVDECGLDNLEQFKDNCKKWDIIKNGEINIMEYSRRYCEIDCEVLRKGYEIFKSWIKTLGDESAVKVDLNIDDIISVASLAHSYLISQGCYEGINMMSGKPREFIQKCVVGGRTMTNSNKKWKISGGKLADNDCTSLYPSAIYQMLGFLKGNPIVLKNTDLKTCLSYDGIFVRCLITKVDIHRQFPLASVMTESGVRDFTNDLVGKEIYLDKQSILDLQEFQKVELNILEGYYYNSGRNPISKSVIRYLFDTRVQKKKEKNPIQAVYKLIMNSAYGKTILRPIVDDIMVINKTGFDKKTKKYVDNWKNYLGKNYNYIKDFTDCGKVVVVKKHKSILEHYNNAHIGVEVLSKSKNIMNKVMCLGEDLGLKQYTQDTDSIHMDYDEVEIMRQAYNKKYNTEIIGTDMGQFHIDFDLEGSVGDIWATDSIFLGKKCYIDKLESRDKDNKPIYGHHIRMKGITHSSIDYTAKKDFGGDVLKMYEHLFDGKSVNFDLLCGGTKDMFKSEKDMTIRTLKSGEFSRTVSFNYEIGVF
tara:strand:+ start:1722 stop:5459 length:3738 start_codon:yes stop_codon:yes gene_type:complete